MRGTLAAALAVGALLAAAAATAAAAAVLAVGDDVPDLALKMADGSDAKLSDHEGKVVVLLFYGTWQKKAPERAKKADELRKARAKQKLVVIGVARDATAADAKKFGEDHALGFPQAADPRQTLWGRFSEKGLPWTVVLDGKRKLRHSAGGFDEESVDAVLTELLGARDAELEKAEKEKDAKEPGAKEPGAKEKDGREKDGREKDGKNDGGEGRKDRDRSGEDAKKKD
jgi:peroxiredoxin